ncbi:MAG: glycosyltransferase family A protein [Candidatus Thorarchaeota archaeon]
MSGYVLATKFFNEREQLPTFIANIAVQTKRPLNIIFIDDGSNDDSAKVVEKEASNYELSYKLVSMPKKAKGNLDTLGRAWTVAQPTIKEQLSDVPYFATADVDTRFPPNYFEYMVNFLDDHPKIGVVAGQIADAPRRTFPMFTGKVVRSDVISYINKYWDISIDSFLNIKALNLGYKVSILDNMLVESPISHMQSKKGRFRAGRLAYYGGTDPLYAIVKAISHSDTEFLRGYWFEFFKGTWRCDDEDIREYYRKEFTRKAIRILKKITRL